MADREYVITFEGEKATVWLEPKFPIGTATQDIALPDPPYVWNGHYHVLAPTAARAEQIARAMRGGKK